MSRKPAQADHAQLEQLAGDASRVDASRAPARRKPKPLPILDPISLPASWQLEPGVPLHEDGTPFRPSECRDTPRPCPYVSCRQHLWLIEQHDRPGNPSKGAQGDATLRPLRESCALDVAARGGQSLEEVGKVMGVNPTRVHQIEQAGIDKLKQLAKSDPFARKAVAAMFGIDLEALES